MSKFSIRILIISANINLLLNYFNIQTNSFIDFHNHLNERYTNNEIDLKVLLDSLLLIVTKQNK